MRELIKKILKEETLKDSVQELVDEIGVMEASLYTGGVENLIKILYDGDLKKYYQENNLEPYKITTEPNLYIDDAMVSLLELPDVSVRLSLEKGLGKFSWVSGGMRYSFNAYLRAVKFTSNKIEWQVVGQSGDSGFGYSFISKRNTLGKKARMQIFKQIIDKYDLDRFK